MQTMSSEQREELQDVWYGQIVTIVARWFLIGAGLLLTFWRAQGVGDAITPTYLIIALIAVNFLLHGRFAIGAPLRKEVVLGACVMDALIISLVIITTRWGAAKGIDNPFYIFYYPVILGFALVFPWRLSFSFSALVIAVYAGIIFLDTPAFALDHATFEPVVARLITLATTAVLGSMYWRMERKWRRSRLSLAS